MPKLITIDEVANRLGLSRRTIDRYIERGEFVATYQFPSGTVRVDELDLDAWLVSLRSDNQPKETAQ